MEVARLGNARQPRPAQHDDGVGVRERVLVVEDVAERSGQDGERGKRPDEDGKKKNDAKPAGQS